ncbi:MAG: ABC transporter permease [Alphaproteobacteria bacterium]
MLDKKLWRNLWAMKTQVLAIALVMAAGLATYVMSAGMFDSLQESREQYYRDYRFADVFIDVKRAPESLRRQIEAIPGVGQTMTRVVVGATLDLPGVKEPATGFIVSLPEGRQPDLNLLHLRVGRLPEPYRENEVVISDAFAEARGMKPGDTLSAIISGHKRDLIVVGVALSPEFIYWLPPGALFPDNKRYAVMWMGRDALEAAHDMDGAFNSAALRLMHDAVERDVIDAVDALTRRYGGLGAYGREDHQSDMFLRNEFEQLEVMAFIVPIIFLAVAAFLLNTVLTRMINLEREEIGTLKALGLSDREVGFHYVKFAGVIALLATVLGVGAGIWLGRGMADLYSEFFRFPTLAYRLDPAIPFNSLLVSVLAAGLGTQQAIRRVMKMRPAEAMHAEPPAKFRPVLLERLGLSALMSPAARMIWRQLERRVRRSLLTCAGIGAALGTLIASSFALDGIDFIMHVEFNESAREDFGVTLTEPLSKQALFDVASLPGVMRAEPYRAVPVKLKWGPRTERVSLLGIGHDANLHRTLDIDLQPIALPSEGVVLTETLAKMLDAKTGDVLTVAVLEGRRPTRQITVTAVVKQLVGFGAYMSLDALNRLMLEGSSVSGAWLSVDSAQVDQFYEQVKQTPAIAGIAIRSGTIQGFEETMAESMLRMTFVNIIFAGIIAFGVVYNSARISVSERGRELASMRVLGFTRGEISTILLGELAILVAFAIPLGCLMGYGLTYLIVTGLETELFRMPMIIDRSTYGWTALVVVAAAALSALVVRRRLDTLNLVEVLKTRE